MFEGEGVADVDTEISPEPTTQTSAQPILSDESLQLAERAFADSIGLGSMHAESEQFYSWLQVSAPSFVISFHLQLARVSRNEGEGRRAFGSAKHFVLHSFLKLEFVRKLVTGVQRPTERLFRRGGRCYHSAHRRTGGG